MVSTMKDLNYLHLRGVGEMIENTNIFIYVSSIIQYYSWYVTSIYHCPCIISWFMVFLCLFFDKLLLVICQGLKFHCDDISKNLTRHLTFKRHFLLWSKEQTNQKDFNHITAVSIDMSVCLALWKKNISSITQLGNRKEIQCLNFQRTFASLHFVKRWIYVYVYVIYIQF